MKKGLMLTALFLILFVFLYAGVTNFGRIGLSESPEITGSNSETISNSTDGAWEFGSANLTTTGSLTVGSINVGSINLDSASGILKMGIVAVGVDTFGTTKTSDTVAISGAAPTDIYIIAINDADPVANDLLSYVAGTDSLFVHRPAGTTSGLIYSWLRITAY